MNFVRLIMVTFALLAGHLLAVAPAGAARGSNIADTPHNLSITGGGGAHEIKSLVELRICIFCHAPHHTTSITPLWSREPSNITYDLYVSTTLTATLQQPRGASRLCLSCHDGTIALGLLGKEPNTLNLDAALPKMPTDVDPRRNPNLGTDLSDDHPVSFTYPADPELNDPSTLKAQGIKLEQDIYVECTACHNPHSNQYGNFLVVNTDVQHDALCTKCHYKAGWNNADSGHRTGGDRYPEIKAQISADGCISCHIPHSSPGRVSLLKGAAEENNCFISCHKDLPYSVNINAQFLKPYRHFVQNYLGAHTQNEQLPVLAAKKHVECVDCHNPHQAGWQGAPMSPPNPLTTPPSAAPAVSGPLRGVRGVDATAQITVDQAAYEYQICFKCHAGLSADQFVDPRFTSTSVLRPDRLIETFDESLRFASNNPSFHPVVVNRPELPGISGRSLLPAFKETLLRIYCSDCHAPHGSDEPYVLDARNIDTFPSTTTDYPLCYRCHDSSFLMTISTAAALHQKHVIGPHDNGDTRIAPCATCHDPHGVPAARGATTQKNAHLINFDARYVGIDSAFNSTTRSCTVTPGPAGSCHATNPKSY